ncbi:hypothetical protein OF83DRAFT_66466 [Amylostereum chailletii]|nr:hypothetical protein OF83DRAFT_66466 [Amylostereum chailletii]
MPHSDISLTYASFVGGWLTGPLYGLNVGLFIVCVRMLYHDVSSIRRRILLSLACIQMAIATAHAICTFIFLIKGFVQNANSPNGTLFYFINQSTPEHVTQELLFFLNYIISDGILVWRCWVVWGHSLWICIPLGVMVLGTAVSGFTTVGKIAQLTSTEVLFDVQDWTTATFSISLGTQVISTALIAWKIMSTMGWKSKSARKDQLAIVWMIVESGAVLTISTIVVLTLFLLGMNAGAILAPIIGQLSFTVPTSIVVRVGMKREKRAGNTLPWYRGNAGGTNTSSNGGESSSGGTLLVNVTKHKIQMKSEQSDPRYDTYEARKNSMQTDGTATLVIS